MSLDVECPGEIALTIRVTQYNNSACGYSIIEYWGWKYEPGC